MRTALHKAGFGTAALLLAALVLFVALPGHADATTDAFAKIPPNQWGCTLCHSASGATPESVPAATAASQTSFGEQWAGLSDQEIDRFWSAMAAKNADRDGCSNGCELNDPFGDFEPGGSPPNTACAEGNPNLGDCTIPLNEDSWSTLKSLFGEN